MQVPTVSEVVLVKRNLLGGRGSEVGGSLRENEGKVVR
jgi:hypothetical protein